MWWCGIFLIFFIESVGDYRLVTTFDEIGDYYSTTFVGNELEPPQPVILSQQQQHPSPPTPEKALPSPQKSTFPVIQRPTILDHLPPLEKPPTFRHSFRIMPEFESNTQFVFL